jgi:hypothetical protein
MKCDSDEENVSCSLDAFKREFKIEVRNLNEEFVLVFDPFKPLLSRMMR